MHVFMDGSWVFTKKKGPTRAKFPEPTKSILIVQPENVKRTTAALSHLGFILVTGVRYINGCIGMISEQYEWGDRKVASWIRASKSYPKWPISPHSMHS